MRHQDAPIAEHIEAVQQLALSCPSHLTADAPHHFLLSSGRVDGVQSAVGVNHVQLARGMEPKEQRTTTEVGLGGVP